MKYEYDTVVIGSWPGWLTVGIWLAILWKKVCMIEKAHIWGDCTNYGCVPSKSLLHYSKIHGKQWNVGAAMEYAREQRQAIRDEETPEILWEYGLETRLWFWSLVDRHTVSIQLKDWSTEKITTKRIVLCTWAKAKTISIPWVDENDLLTNENLFEIDYDIKNLVIIWDGIIACEMAEAFSGVWVNVTLLARDSNILHTADTDVWKWMETYLQKKWVNVLCNTIPVWSNQTGLLTVSNKKEEKTIHYDKILLAIGKTPLISWLWLDKIWIHTDTQWIITNAYGRTSIKNIRSIWDCVSNNPRLTHWSNHQWRHLVQNMIAWFGFVNPSEKNHPLPSVIYTDSEVARVWLDEKKALQKYAREDLVIRTHHFTEIDRNKVTESWEWFMKIIAKRWTLTIVWVTIVGKHAGEMLPLYVYAIKKWVTLWSLSSLIFAYPTRSEIIKRLIDEYFLEISKNRKKELIWAIKKVCIFWKW